MGVRAAALVLEGGPLDGGRLPVHRCRGALVWVGFDGRTFDKPGPRRALYERDGPVLRFAGHAKRPCGGCGGILGADDAGNPLGTCALCGHVQRR